MKSLDIEDWLDLHISRPLAFVFVRLFAKLGIHPNAVSILSMVIGVCSGLFFVHGSWYYEGVYGLVQNIIGVLLLWFAYILDCVDGQLARYTGKCTRLGRILDGVASAFWYIPLYLLVIYRIYRYHDIEFSAFGVMETTSNIIIYTVIVAVIVHLAGYLGNMEQERMADYFNQIYLFFVKGEKGSELDDSAKLQKAFDELPADTPKLDRISHSSYISYTKLQEKKTPEFQKMKALMMEKYGSSDNIPESIRTAVVDSFRPLTRINALLTFNFRTIFLALFCIADLPVLYFVFELVVMGLMERSDIRRHEEECRKFCDILAKEN